VHGAWKYSIEIQYENEYGNGKVTGEWFDIEKIQYSKKNHFYMDGFVGGQPGRWRVRAIDANGLSGQSSDWRMFRFTR